MDCSICLEKIENGSAELSCKHKFHLKCIVKWLGKLALDSCDKTCPMCRKVTDKDDNLPIELFFQVEKYCSSFQDEMHRLLKHFGGRGLSQTVWNAMEKKGKMIIDGVLVLSHTDLDMLMITNGCRRTLERHEFISLTNSNNALWEY